MTKRFSPEEVAFLKENYDNLSLSELEKSLPGRSNKSIRQKLKELSLIKTNNKKYWTEEEDKQLITLWENEKLLVYDIAKILKRSWNSIYLRSQKLKIKRKFRFKNLTKLNINNFYLAIKNAKLYGTLKCQCCLCEYNKYVQLHHIDGNNKNHHISNISTLCPTHHVEVEFGEHKDKILYAIWWRIYEDGSIGPIETNKNLLKFLDVSDGV